MSKGIQNTTENIIKSFTKGLNKDSDPSFVGEGMWTHARNAVNNTDEGNLGSITNEQSNFLCATAGATMLSLAVNKYIIGAILLYSDKWIIFTAGHNSRGLPIMSEIGLLETDHCRYRPIVQDACLAFDKRFLISGSARETEDCSWQVYWADGKNPDRYLNVGDPKTWPTPDYNWLGGGSTNYYSNGINTRFLWPGVKWKELCTDSSNTTQTEPDVWPPNHPVEGCITCKQINQLDCDKIRMARLMSTPCLKLKLGQQGGTLRNGTYFALIAYAIKGQRVTDYFSQSNYQFVWSPQDVQGSLTLDVEADSVNFDEFILVIVQTINQGTVAKQIGTYSTRTTTIALDQIKEDLISVPLEQLPLQTPVFEKSDQIAEVNDYLLRVGVTSKFDFNYQPLANLIQARWASVEYPADYYVKGGNKTSYLRDEVYSFFIRWVYDTGDKSASYHIPGRVGTSVETAQSFDRNALSTDDQYFDVFNTASKFSTSPFGVNAKTDDGGTIIAVGEMGYWQSTEKYPDDKPEVWNSSVHCWTPVSGLPNPSYDLCGLPIRHHKFPENMLDPSTTNHFAVVPNSQQSDLKIRIMGVYFENITYPKDNDGLDIPGIVGYEILRGSREGNKTIIAKGMLNNFRTYDIKGSVQNTTAPRIGLYANYPFNTIRPYYNTATGNNHNVNYNDPYIRIPKDKSKKDVINQDIPRDIVSFHSPDTMFRNPFLSATELKLYGYLRGSTTQKFIEPNQHPKFKLISDFVLAPMYINGVLKAALSFTPKMTKNTEAIQGSGYTIGAVVPGLFGATQLPGAIALQGASLTYNGLINQYFSQGGAFVDGLANVFTGTTPGISSIEAFYNAAVSSAVLTGAVAPKINTYNVEFPEWSYMPLPFRIANSVTQGIMYFFEGAETVLKLIQAAIPYEQYALQMIAHGFYTSMGLRSTAELFRFKIADGTYLRDNLLQLPYYADYLGNPKSYVVNNLKRSDTLLLRTLSGPYFNPTYPNGVNTGPYFITENNKFVDQSLTTLGHVVQEGVVNVNTLAPISPSGANLPDFEETDIEFNMPIGSHYAAIKVRLQNQYGQLDGIKQIVITPCEQKFKYSDLQELIHSHPCSCGVPTQLKTRSIPRTPVFFGGDTYINRYTEKNTMFFFYDWLFQQPDGFEYNYLLRQMIQQPRFWVNSTAYDIGSLDPSNIISQLINNNLNNSGAGILPSSYYRLDFDGYNYATDPAPGLVNYPGLLRAKDAKFYLAASGVRDFFVESEVLVDFREAGVEEFEKHYDPYRYTDLVRMFDMNPQIITRGNIYRYDYSLSVSKLYNQYFSSGVSQSKNYNPFIASLCYVYFPDRIHYSLPQQQESFKDSWLIYLPNNYKEFVSQISGVKSINKSGLFITFKNDSPVMYQGIDTLQTDLGTKVTLGDGGLFSQAPQVASNADRAYEYGSSQSRLAVIATPAGVFYVSQNQGKVFSYSGGLKEISQIGLKWWFAYYLRSQLALQFPEYPWVDNPVAGVGCQAIYDNENSLLYITKKDYSLRDNINPDDVKYIPYVTEKCGRFINGKYYKQFEGDFFTYQDKGTYLIGDPFLFQSASWTLSYDPKSEFWISYHDWHPDLVIPTKSVFLTTKKNTIWKHNRGCDSYCNFYGIDYPFEIEFPIVTGQSSTTLKSFEYILESYKGAPNCIDQFHVLDHNFDTAIVYNTEQISGYLNLNIYPKNNVALSLQYPKFNPAIPVIIEDTVVGVPGFDILFSKEENKYRFNQFWDVTRNRGEFPDGSGYPPQGPLVPGTTELLGNYQQQILWSTLPDGYRRELNLTSLDLNKPELQRKKFRHYLNFLTLRKEVSNDIQMIVKIVNSKNQISLR